MKRQIVSTLLALCMVLALLPGAARAENDSDIAYPVAGGNIYFDADTGTITGCDSDVTEAVIPSKIGDVAVTSIGNAAFSECQNLIKVEIPDSVTSIGEWTFDGCWSLSDVNIPNNVTRIGDRAFYECKVLTRVKIPDKVTSIGAQAFRFSDLNSVEIPGSVIDIGLRAFSGCEHLTGIHVASENPAYSSVDGVLFNADQTLLHTYPWGKANTSYSIPASVTRIESEAFAFCEGLTSLTIPISVTSIADWAFWYPYYPSFCNLTDIHYGGSEEDWANIDIGKGNAPLSDDTLIRYSSSGANDPNIPDEPDTPDEPGTPDEPDIPNTPNTPDEPNTPPSEPAWPSYPSGGSTGGSSSGNNSGAAAAPSTPDPAPAAPDPEPETPAPSEPPADPVPVPSFADVSESDWFYADVAYVVQNGLMGSMDDGNFNPNGTTTRGMLMTILARLDGVDTGGSSPWYQAGMEWAARAGVSDGSNPEADITREELATMLWRYAGRPAAAGDLTAYPDTGDVHDWASDAMLWAVQNGIINGSDGKLEPQGTAIRAQAAAMLTRFCKNIEK